MTVGRKGFFILFLVLLAAVPAAYARDVAFVEPGTGGGTTTLDEAFKIEPKSEVDIGDSVLNIVRRQSLFFVNQTSAPIKVEKVTISSDSTVTATVDNDDCSKEATLLPLSRCAIELSVTPTGPGSWGIELLMTHNGPGRITRAKIIGKTGGGDTSDKKDHGLFLSAKDVKPIDFGEVTVGDGKIVRSALMINDSPSPISLYSIDVVEADKTLQRLDMGCSADMELKPGESCPVTLAWSPTNRGVISTDLIIRHSGQLGFAVVPVRGTAKGNEKEGDNKDGPAKVTNGNSNRNDAAQPPPPTPSEVAREVAKDAISGHSAHAGGADSLAAATGSVHLIGTVGNRAVLLKPDGSTAIVNAGDQVDLGGSSPAKVVSVSGNAATLTIDGKKKDLMLEAVQELKDKASANKKDAASGGASGGSALGGSFAGVGGGNR